MSSPQRRKELEVIHAREQEAREKEKQRRENLSMYSRIEEIESMDDVKDILHRIANKLAMD